MELRQLRYLLAVADTGSFTAAADREHVAQPALWKQVRSLERELGVEMFVRTGRRIALTATGDLVVSAARRAVGSADEVHRLAGDLRAGRKGVVRIASFGPPVSTFLASLVHRVSQERPEVRLELHEMAMTQDVARGADPATWVLGGRADIGIGGTVPVACESFVAYQTHVAIVAPPGHGWERRRRIDVTELRGQPLVTAAAGYQSRTQLDVACANAGFEPNTVLVSPNPVSILALVRAGVGLGVLTDDAAGTRPDGRPWPHLAVGAVELGAPVHLYWTRGRHLPSAVAALVEIAREITGGGGPAHHRVGAT